ncbi:ecto-NOX disulfide-thiol exchanger 1-like isoform X2 [Acanthaster planci]|nr:ecto-NOX disulfide-thiol exchanger 1-like isoform X2 [Acanthaster planci]XP_022098677.1 ecto-NOX disulfide-thiol exchanger 1-like isoform X2 [Acanthaster planci]XP_022098678.1 ecto-NOX disulfide-thiol exchanger 1-like isoform X2 [Acanthaster planci]
MAGNFQNQRFLPARGSQGNMGMSGIGLNVMNQPMGFMEPGYNDKPLEFSGSLRNEPQVIDGDSSLSRLDDEGSSDISGDLHRSLHGSQWGMDHLVANYSSAIDYMAGDVMAMGQYAADVGNPGGRQGLQRVLTGSGFTLTSPPPGRQPARPTREKPIGCCTIFVGGLPALCTNEMLHEIFENFGTIRKLLRIGTRFYCHIRFMDEDSVDKAFEVSGYRIKVENKNDPDHSGVLRVDYSESRDDEAEYMRKQEEEERKRREEARLVRREEEKLRQMARHSESEAQRLTEKLKAEDSFPSAVTVLISWLDRGDCKKQTANSFFSLVQAAFSQTRRLSSEKQRLDEQIRAMTEMARKQTGDIYSQLSLINQVFVRATKQPSRDQFSKAQRKHIDSWKKSVQELCTPIQEELGMTDKGEADMDVSDEEETVISIKEEQGAKRTLTDEEESKRPKLNFEPPPPPSETPAPSITPGSISRDEADALRCQLEAFRNEVDLLKTEKVQYADEKETQIKALQHALLGMQQQLMETKNKLKKEDEMKKAEKSDSESDSKEASSSKGDISSTEGTELMENDAMLVGIISTFLHVHPFGASVEYLWSYLQRLSFNVSPQQIEALLIKFPKMFKQELFGVGATLEKRWKFIGYNTCMGLSPSNRTSTN